MSFVAVFVGLRGSGVQRLNVWLGRFIGEWRFLWMFYLDLGESGLCWMLFSSWKVVTIGGRVCCKRFRWCLQWFYVVFQ